MAVTKNGHYHCSIRQLRRTEARKNGKPASALAAAFYIKRKGDYSPRDLARMRRKHEKEEQLLASGVWSMPTWAAGRNEDEKFWKTADEYERANGRLALKIECAIPRQVPREQWPALIKDFCVQQLNWHPTSWAVHEGQASDGGTNPHIHFLVSERRIDVVERSPELFFRRANPKNPQKGGAAKDRAWHDKSFFHRVRTGWADVVNQHLAMAGSEVRIDHRSNVTRGIPALPGTHDGPARRAMKARGIQLRNRPSQIRKKAMATELAAIDAHIFKLTKEKSMFSSANVHSDPERREEQAMLSRAHMSIDNRGPRSRPKPPVVTIDRDVLDGFWLDQTYDERDFKYSAETRLRNAGFDLVWLPAIVGQVPAEGTGDLPSFRAAHKDGREVWGGGRKFHSSHEDAESLTIMADLCAKAGMKKVTLTGTDEAIRTLTALLNARGIEVTNAPGQEQPAGAGTPPPPSPPVAAKPASKKTCEQIARKITGRQFHSAINPQVEGWSPAEGRKQIPMRHIFNMARDAARFDAINFQRGNDRDQVDHLAFLLIVEQDFPPSHLSAEDGRFQRSFPRPGENQNELKPSQSLARALRDYYRETGLKPKPEVQAFIREGLGLLPPTAAQKQQQAAPRKEEDPNHNGPK